MEKMEILRISLEVASVVLSAFFAGKMFRYKNVILEILNAAKDGKVTEQEFQGIIDEVKKEIYGESK